MRDAQCGQHEWDLNLLRFLQKCGFLKLEFVYKIPGLEKFFSDCGTGTGYSSQF